MAMLLNDVCRCHDDKCEKRETCLRWLERNKFKQGWPVTTAKTLRGDNDECECYVKGTE